MFKLVELVRWLGITQFEILVNLVSIFIFTICLALKIENHITSWYTVFIPLFCGDICNGYFCIIVVLRMFLVCDNRRKSFHRLAWSAKVIALTSVFKYLLCLKLADDPHLDYSEVLAPIFVLLQLIAIRACQLSNAN